MDDTLSLTPDALHATLGTAQCPALIDVRIPEDMTADPWRVPGAIHVPHRDLAKWLETDQSSRPLVIICHKGLKLSQGAAAQLRAAGRIAHALEGGNVAWQEHNFPRLSLATAPAIGTPWVLPFPTSPSALCATWLIRRWIDPDANLLWVPQDMVADVASRFDAIPFGTTQSLTEICENAGLQDARLETFIDGIDTHAHAWLNLLVALPQLHPTAEAQVAAALPLIDLAWTAAKGGIA